MSNEEYNSYKWLDAQEHKPTDKDVGNKGQEQRMIRKMLDFFEL